MRRRRWIAGMIVALALVFVCAAYALDPNRMIPQYAREHWGSENGFVGGSINAMTQTGDGYLWIGTDKGLVRFDGSRFQTFPQAVPSSLPIGAVRGLVADAQGNLWILLRNTRILRYHDGVFEIGREEAEVGITAIGKRRDGSVVFSSITVGTLTYRAGKFESLAPPQTDSSAINAETPDDLSTRLSWATGVAIHRLAEPNSPVIAMAETADGRVWLGTQDRGLFYFKDGKVTSAPQGLPDKKVNCILNDGDQKLWIGTDRGMVRWDGRALTQSAVPATLRRAQILSVIRDRDANLWVGTPDGLLRFNADGLSIDQNSQSSYAAVTSLFEDREGNVWSGGASGLDRLRDSPFISYAKADGLPSEGNGPVYVDNRQRTWFAPLEGGLYWLRGQRVERVTNDGLDTDVVYSITGNKDELWIGRQRGGLTQLRFNGASITSKTYTQADGLAQNSVYAVAQSRDGTVWAGTLSGGLAAFHNGQFKIYTAAVEMAANTVNAIAEAGDGTVWFATPNGLNSFSNDKMSTLTDGLPSRSVNCLLSDSGGVLWIGTAKGLAFLDSGTVRAPEGIPVSLHQQIFGMAEDKNGWLWLSTSNRVLRVEREKLLRGNVSDDDVREYGISDGMLGVEGVKRQQSVVADPLGRIWFSMNRGLSVVDSSRAVVSPAPTLVQIETISADGNAIDTKGDIRVPSARKRISFNYAGLSLSNPGRVRYRYRLDGFDHGWSDPVTTRETTYTNLSPGQYRFRVMASNSDGSWNGPETVFPFEVTPMFWQTWWFRLSALMLFAAVVSTAYRFRLHQTVRGLNVRFEERLAERTRIAQDLHDTLLQGVLSAFMQLHVADSQLPEASPAKPLIGRVLQLMTQVVDDGRNAVRGLRSGNNAPPSFEQAFSGVQQELAFGGHVGFRVIVEGEPRPVHPMIRDEVYFIGREALANAFRHAQATHVEIELEYTAHDFRVLVRDDGCGIDPHVLRSGREGHWGLSGMHERAERIGAKLKVWSRSPGGTEVELSVPSHVAFRSAALTPRMPWLTGLLQKKSESELTQQGKDRQT